MKNAHFSLLFLCFIACGSQADKALNTTYAPPASTVQTPAVTATAAPTQPSVDVTPIPSPSVTPSPVPSAISTPAPVPTPTAAPSDPYVGTYAATTLPLTYDGCAGACSPSVTVNPLVVTHDNGSYQMSGANASILPNSTVLNAEVTGATTIFNCSNAVFADDYGIEARADGTYHELLTHGTAGDCHGGVHYTCQCQYEAIAVRGQ